MLILLLVIAWIISGTLSFIFWWTKDYNFTSQQFGICFLASLLGPFSFILGFFIQGFKNSNEVIIERRNR